MSSTSWIGAIRATAFLSIVIIVHATDAFPQGAPTENASSPDKQLSSMAGRVVRIGNDEPLRKARVLLTNEEDNSSDPYIAITGTEGEFSITGITPGRYKLRVERDGYVAKWNVEDASGNSLSVLSLKPGQQMSDLLFRLQRSGVIAGRVLDEDGDPAQGVEIETVRRSTSRGRVSTWTAGVVETNDLGEYRVFGLHQGRYFVRAQPRAGSGSIIGRVLVETSILKSAGGYVPTYYPGVSDISRASAIDVKPGDEITGVDLILMRGSSHRIRGVVVNAVTGHPNAQTSVGAVPKDMEFSSEYGREGEVNEKSGEFEIDDVRNGSYIVCATWRDGENEFTGLASIEVLNADVNSVRIIITRGVEVHGRVIQVGKIATAPSFAVDVNPRDESVFGSRHNAKVAADGSFTVSGLSDGLYEIDVDSNCATCYVKSASANGTDILDSGFQVNSGTAPSLIELVYSSSSSTVDGVVVRTDGSPAVDATVVLLPDPPRRNQTRLYREATVDQFGHFVLKRLIPGKYHAFAWENVDFDDYTDPDFLREFEQKGQSVSIGENEKKTLQLTLISPSSNNQ